MKGTSHLKNAAYWLMVRSKNGNVLYNFAILIRHFFFFSRILDKIKVTEKQPEIPDGESETVDIATSKSDASVDEKLPETPDGESRSEAHETNELKRNINGSKLPKIPTGSGKKHDEM